LRSDAESNVMIGGAVEDSSVESRRNKATISERSKEESVSDSTTCCSDGCSSRLRKARLMRISCASQPHGHLV
jgi:hypothetical protein